MKINLNCFKDTLLYDFMIIKNYSSCQFKRKKDFMNSYSEQFRIIERNGLLEGYFFWNNYNNKDNYGLTLKKDKSMLMETVIFDKNNKNMFSLINVYNMNYMYKNLNHANKNLNINKKDIRRDIIESLRKKDDRHII